MEYSLYCNIVKVINSYRGLSKNCLTSLESAFPTVRHGTLCSILAHEYQKRMKIKHSKTSETIYKYYKTYQEGVKRNDPPGIIVRLAEEVDVAPCLVAKLILSKHYEGIDGTCSKSLTIGSYLRDTSLIPDVILSYEVFLCTLYDNQYSPIVEAVKSSLGQQYEIKLYRRLREMNLSYRDEEYLRKFGYDKTPDVKLEVPIAIDGFIIHWIESKALFGDEDNHKDYTKNQYISYYNRFGAGLVIYWFGYIETLVSNSEKRFIIKDSFPTNVIKI